MPELLDPTSKITSLCRRQGITIALMTDARFSGGSSDPVGFVIGHVGPEAFLGGPIALVEDGDTIVVDLEENWIDCLQLDDSETYQQASRTLVADDDHVVVVKVVGPFAKCMDQGSFAVEDASVAREDPVRHPALDTGELQDRSAIGSEIPSEASAGRRCP